MSQVQGIEEIVQHIDKAFERPCGESFWLDENGNKIRGVDTGYAFEWWRDCMKPELLRVFSQENPRRG